MDIVAVRRESFDIADRMPRPEEIQRICSSLVTSVVNGKGRHRTIQLQLAHSSVQEFLLGHADVGLQPAASINLTRTCLAYLRGIAFHEASRGTEMLGNGKGKGPQCIGEEPNFHLGFHAAISWMDYAKKADEQKCTELITTAAEFLLDQYCYTAWYQQYWPAESVQHEGGPLYFASKHGLRNLVRELISRGEDVNDHSRNGPPIFAASSNGHKNIVELLIENGADLDARSSYWGQTSLEAACRNGYKAVADLLLDAGADWRTWDDQAHQYAVKPDSKQRVRSRYTQVTTRVVEGTCRVELVQGLKRKREAASSQYSDDNVTIVGSSAQAMSSRTRSTPLLQIDAATIDRDHNYCGPVVLHRVG